MGALYRATSRCVGLRGRLAAASSSGRVESRFRLGGLPLQLLDPREILGRLLGDDASPAELRAFRLQLGRQGIARGAGDADGRPKLARAQSGGLNFV